MMPVAYTAENCFKALPYLMSAVEMDGTHRMEDIWLSVESGEAQLWLGEESAAVSYIRQYPLTRTFNFWLAGGDLYEVRRLCPKVLDWARENGCKKAQIDGRPGWERIFRWDRKSVKLVRAL